MPRRTVLVTSALPYVNNVPHLGNLIGATLSADVFARFMRSRGNKVLYVCGTDEHGTATETKAREEGVTPKELCDKYFAIHKDVYDWFGISFDIFGRTSDPVHIGVTQQIFKRLEQNGYVLEQEVEQLYSEHDKMWLADRYVLGECPHCGYLDARGDQCDNCGKLLTPTELINPRSALSGAKPVRKKTKHLYIDLPKLQPKLAAWLQDKEFSDNTMQVTAAWLRDGLKPRAITRDLKWGVPVPREGYENKVFYVWFDAPIGYISMSAASAQGIDYWWKNKDIELYQFMGKDNIPFHSVIFPSVLLGTGDEWNTVKHINTTEFLNYEDTKFSKSRGTGVFCDDAKSLGLPADVWRYYLLTNRPENSDTAFSWKDFQGKLNGELVANLGNLVNRTTSFINQYYDGRIPKYESRVVDEEFRAEIRSAAGKITDEIEAVHLKDALHRIMRASSAANGYFQQQQPWKSRTENPPACAAAIATLAQVLVDLAILIEPYLPHTAAEICRQLKTDLTQWDSIGLEHLKGGHTIEQNAILFRKVEDKEIAEWKERFSGKKQTVKTKTAQHEAALQGTAAQAHALSSVRLVVGKITGVTKHPNADKLYVETIFDGEKERTIVSGLAPHYEPGELLGKHIVLVANLQPAKLRGVTSEGMLLAAENEHGEVGVVVSEAEPGTLVRAKEFTPTDHQIVFDTFSKVNFSLSEAGLFADGHELTANGKKLLPDKGIFGKVR